MKLAFAVLGCLLAGCAPDALEPRGQVLLHVDTDAPLPPSPGELPGETDPLPLFDRVRIEIFRPGESEPCTGCSREFELHHGLLASGRASVGIVPEPGERLIARVRLYRAASSTAEGPPVWAAVERTVLMPPVGEEGVSEVTVRLFTDDVGVPVGSLAAPVEPEPGAPSPSLVGTWPHAARVPCSEPPAPDEACVPGGAFWMGNPALRGFLEGTDADRERIVVLSPFFIERTEVTVERARAAGLLPAVVWTGDEDGDAVQDWCTYASAPSARDVLPVSCVLWVEAQSYCHSLGRELPTEAQYEYVAGALAARRYPWGSDEPTCTDAVWGRAGFGAFDTYPDRCRPVGTIGLPEPPGWGARDVVRLGGAEVVDLAGNVKEWMLDRWNRQDEPCWSGPGVYRDPVCEVASFADGAVRSVRGGAWQFDGTFLSGAVRGRENPNNVYPSVGFRCARAD